MSKIKYYSNLLLFALLVAMPVVLLCFFVYATIDNTTLNSKVIYFNVLFFTASGWWITLVSRSNDLKKYESSLSSTQENFLKSIIDKMSDTIWGIIYFNFFGAFTTFLSLVLGDSISAISLPILSFYFLVLASLLLFFSRAIKNRIESASVLLAKKEKEERKKEDIIKSLKSGLEKFEKDARFEAYNTVVKVGDIDTTH